MNTKLAVVLAMLFFTAIFLDAVVAVWGEHHFWSTLMYAAQMGAGRYVLSFAGIAALFWLVSRSPLLLWLLTAAALVFAFACWPAIYLVALLLVYIPKHDWGVAASALLLVAPLAFLCAKLAWPSLRNHFTQSTPGDFRFFGRTE